MQCRLPRKNVPNKKSNLTWYLNNQISWSAAATYYADFTCDGGYYDAINLTFSVKPGATLYIKYRKHGLTTWTKVAELQNILHWINEVYRTITFDAPPTGDLLTWLTANATPQ